jgi:hypothetical protein
MPESVQGFLRGEPLTANENGFKTDSGKSLTHPAITCGKMNRFAVAFWQNLWRIGQQNQIFFVDLNHEKTLANE